MSSEIKKYLRGFTLIELLVTIAIISVLAAVVLISMSSFRVRARSAKALGQLSSAIPSTVSCWGNTVAPAGVNNPVGGGNICSLGNSYGIWPQTAGDLSTYSYGDINIDNTTNRSRSWSFSLRSNTDNVKVCCNSAMNSCKSDVSGSTCNATTPSY